MSFNPKKLKSDFPIFNQKHNFDKLVYLDNGATTQKPLQVINGITEFYSKNYSNVHRSIHDLGESATSLYEQAREKVAIFLNANPEEIIFTSGTTESINFVADAWLRKNISKDNNVIVTQAEHHANFLPWLRVVQDKKAKIKFIELNKEDFSFVNFDPQKNDFINNKTKLISLIHTSNVLGDVWQDQNQLEKIIQKAHSVGAKVMLDSAQSSPRQKIDVKKLDIDFLAFSGHKMLAPTGIGILYIKKELHEQVEPYQVGGSMVYNVAWDKAEWRKSPQKFEAGTPPIAQAIGLGYAIDYLTQNVNFKDLKKHEALLCNYLISGLDKINGIRILGNRERLKKNGHLISFTIDGIHVHDLSAFLSQKGISVRSGNHCAQPLSNLLKADASLRVSFYLYNTLRDVDLLLEELNNAIKYFCDQSFSNQTNLNKKSYCNTFTR
ncbi:SufS family cysteine desulfurase [Candidatus Dependentiae bacterium]